MSPRAAWRLEALGFGSVYDYVTGKADWLAAGLPTQGEGPRPARVAEVIDRTVLTCTPDQRVGDVVQRLGSDWDICVVINDQRIVQGRLRRDRVAENHDRPVGAVMEPGPATVRADADLTETSERMKQRGVKTLIVSTPDGDLLGVLCAETTTPRTGIGSDDETG